MSEDTTPILHAEVVRAISKAGNPYECIEVKLDDMTVGRLFPTPLEMATIKSRLYGE